MSRTRLHLLAVAALGLLTAVCSPTTPGQVARMLVTGDERNLRDRPAGAEPNSPGRPGLLVLAIDGVDRKALYPLLREGALPALAKLLGGDVSGFPHAYFDDSVSATLPSSTTAAWVSTFTGVPPAVHGVTGNEFFIRERRQLAVPISGAVSDAAPGIACYSEDYLDKLSLAPSIYERMRARDPDVRIWSAMQQFHRGADKLLLTDRTVYVTAFQAFIEDTVAKAITQTEQRAMYASLDSESIDQVVDALAKDRLPDVLTIYLAGADQYAHVADEGPDEARKHYLIEVIDPLIDTLRKSLDERGALANRYVVVTGDHGHTEVLRDDEHSLSVGGDDEPPSVLENAGFRVRPFQLDVSDDADFQSVITYQGAMAFVYLADRSRCAAAGQACEWSRPPRYREDVLAAAEAFWQANNDGTGVPQMQGTLDMVLTRRPKPVADTDLPFQVYVGGGKLRPVADYLRAFPRRSYVNLDARLRDLGVGPAGERAGDIVLLTHNGDRDRPEERFYFSRPMRSHHGSPSAGDSDVTLIVAHPDQSTSAIQARVQRALGPNPRQQKVGEVLLALRLGRAPKSP